MTHCTMTTEAHYDPVASAAGVVLSLLYGHFGNDCVHYVKPR